MMVRARQFKGHCVVCGSATVLRCTKGGEFRCSDHRHTLSTRRHEYAL